MNPMVLAFFLCPEVEVQRILYKDSHMKCMCIVSSDVSVLMFT